MFPIPCIVKRSDGSHVVHRGILFQLPPELSHAGRMDRYFAISTPGWSMDDYGYSQYASELPTGDLLIFPGLDLMGQVRPKKRFYMTPPQLTRQQVEAMALSFGSFLADEEAKNQSKTAMFVHDIRALSTIIYHSAREAKQLLLQGSKEDAASRLENVVQTQAMLKMRTDAIDFEGNRLSPTVSDNISIFKKVDKVARCFKARAASQGKSLNFGGQSLRVTKGPDILELVPYALIDNAIKYAPRGSVIGVSVHDAAGTLITVNSLGPRLRKNEREEIFKRGTRGEAAGASGVSGSGLGLHMARKIVSEGFGGTIHVEQSLHATTLDGAEYFETTFTVTLPSRRI